MTTSYFSRPRQWWTTIDQPDDYLEYQDSRPEIIVVDESVGSVFTGLLDKDGNPLYRAANRVGF